MYPVHPVIAHCLQQLRLQQVPEYTEFVLNEHNYGYFKTVGGAEAMNYSTAVFLINDDVRALYVVYEPDRPEAMARRYIVKTLDKNIQVGDVVVVPHTMGLKMTTVRVEEVDVEVDFDSTTLVPWVIQRVDLDPFANLVEQEEEALKLIKEAHFKERRTRLAKSLLTSKKLKALPLASRKDEEDGDVTDLDRYRPRL